jgi:hypothetical protein
MNSYTRTIVAIAVLAALSVNARTHAQSRVNWIGPAGLSHAWDEGDVGGGEGVNWQSVAVPTSHFQPDSLFNEYASISNGGVALVDHMITHIPTDIRVAEGAGTTGTLIIQNGGSISASPSTNGTGALLNGAGGTGRVVVRQNIGAVNFLNYTQTATSTLVAQLSSATAFNAMQVTNAVTLAGTLRIERTPGSGFTATTGSSWTLIQGAPVNGAFTGFEVDPNVVANPGIVFATSTSGNAVTITAAQRLVLEVDRFTGAATLRNPSGHATSIPLISYTLSSTQNGVSSAANRWTSFSDAAKPGWFEANPSTTALSELNPQGSLTLASGDSHNFGTPINANTGAALGTNRVNTANVNFQYQAPTGELLSAVIQPVGRINDLVLVVNPATGASLIQNQSAQNLQLVGYTISSASGALKADWAGLQGLPVANWFKANPTTTNLSELISTGATPMNVGAELSVGNAWNAAGLQDLTFSYLTPDGQQHSGSVFFGAKAVVPTGNADFNGDGIVNGADFLKWQRGLGLNGQSNNLNGDANGDGTVSAADLAIWKSQFGTAVSTGSIGAVPEPTSVLLASMALALVGLRGRRGRRDEPGH